MEERTHSYASFFLTTKGTMVSHKEHEEFIIHVKTAFFMNFVEFLVIFAVNILN
jgi:hypothetical protein